MAKGTKASAGAKYIDLITKSEDTKSAELVALEVKKAENVLEQGILSIQAKLLKEQGEVKQAEINLENARQALTKVCGAMPFSVQSVLDNRARVMQAENELEFAIEKQAEVKAAHDYLVNLKAELF